MKKMNKNLCRQNMWTLNLNGKTRAGWGESLVKQEENTEEITQSEAERQRDRKHGRIQWASFPESEKEENGGEAIFEERIGENFPKMKEVLGHEIQKLKKHT